MPKGKSVQPLRKCSVVVQHLRLPPSLTDDAMTFLWPSDKSMVNENVLELARQVKPPRRHQGGRSKTKERKEPPSQSHSSSKSPKPSQDILDKAMALVGKLEEVRPPWSPLSSGSSLNMPELASQSQPSTSKIDTKTSKKRKEERSGKKKRKNSSEEGEVGNQRPQKSRSPSAKRISEDGSKKSKESNRKLASRHQHSDQSKQSSHLKERRGSDPSATKSSSSISSSDQPKVRSTASNEPSKCKENRRSEESSHSDHLKSRPPTPAEGAASSHSKTAQGLKKGSGVHEPSKASVDPSTSAVKVTSKSKTNNQGSCSSSTTHKSVLSSGSSGGSKRAVSSLAKPKVLNTGATDFDLAMVLNTLPRIPKKKKKLSCSDGGPIIPNTCKDRQSEEVRQMGVATTSSSLASPIITKPTTSHENQEDMTEKTEEAVVTPQPTPVPSDNDEDKEQLPKGQEKSEQIQADGTNERPCSSKSISFAELQRLKASKKALKRQCLEEGEISSDSDRDSDIEVLEIKSVPKAKGVNKTHSSKRAEQESQIRIISDASKTNEVNVAEGASPSHEEPKFSSQSSSASASSSTSVHQEDDQRLEQEPQSGQEEHWEPQQVQQEGRLELQSHEQESHSDDDDAIELSLTTEDRMLFDEPQTTAMSSTEEGETVKETNTNQTNSSCSASNNVTTSLAPPNPSRELQQVAPLPLSPSHLAFLEVLRKENLCLFKLEMNACSDENGSCKRIHDIRPVHILAFFELIRDSFDEALPPELRSTSSFDQRVQRLMTIYNSHKVDLSRDPVTFVKLVLEVSRSVRTSEPNSNFCWYMDQCVKDLVSTFPHSHRLPEIDGPLSETCDEIVLTFEELPEHLRPKAATILYQLFVMAMKNELLLKLSTYESLALFAAKNHPDVFAASVMLCHISSLPFVTLKPKTIFYLLQRTGHQLKVEHLACIVPAVMTLTTRDLECINPQILQKFVVTVTDTSRLYKDHFHRVGAPFILRLMKLKIKGIYVDRNCLKDYIHDFSLSDELAQAFYSNNVESVVSRYYALASEPNYSLLRVYNIDVLETLTVDDDIERLNQKFDLLRNGIFGIGAQPSKILERYIQQLAASVVMHIAHDNNLDDRRTNSFVDFLLRDFHRLQIFTPFVPESLSNALSKDRYSPSDIKCAILSIMVRQRRLNETLQLLLGLPIEEERLIKTQGFRDFLREFVGCSLSAVISQAMTERHTKTIEDIVTVYKRIVVSLLGSHQQASTSMTSSGNDEEDLKHFVSTELYSLIVMKQVEWKLASSENYDLGNRLMVLLDTFISSNSHHSKPTSECVRSLVYYYGHVKQEAKASSWFKMGVASKVYSPSCANVHPRVLRVGKHMTLHEIKSLVTVFLEDLRSNLTGPERAMLAHDLDGDAAKEFIRIEVLIENIQGLGKTGMRVIDYFLTSGEEEAMSRLGLVLSELKLGLMHDLQRKRCLHPAKLYAYLKQQ